eukprot:COSAG05_NODE_622_length_8291_cov_19.484985_1_plen_78_part_10
MPKHALDDAVASMATSMAVRTALGSVSVSLTILLVYVFADAYRTQPLPFLLLVGDLIQPVIGPFLSICVVTDSLDVCL